MSSSRSIPPPEIVALMRLAWEQLQGEMLDGLHEQGFDDLRPAHRSLLRYPAVDGLRPTGLANRDGLSKQTINDLLRDLERLGYITLERDPGDRRARLIRFTDRGWRVYDAATALSRRAGRRWAKLVGSDRFGEFESVLREIVASERPSPIPPPAPSGRSAR